MSLRITYAVDRRDGAHRALFLSASIPNPKRWDGEFDPLAITDAVVAVAREFLSAGWAFITAAHPTIAPLLMYVAAELPVEGRRRVMTYQSDLFEDVLPPDTQRFIDEGIGRVIWTPAVEGDEPEPGHWDRSLEVMRRQMFEETKPDAAVFVGGMEGIRFEYELFGELRTGQPRYVLGAPGGAAQRLEQPASELGAELAEGVVFPAIARAILNDLG
jgi:hypothetical protein